MVTADVLAAVQGVPDSALPLGYRAACEREAAGLRLLAEGRAHREALEARLASDWATAPVLAAHLGIGADLAAVAELLARVEAVAVVPQEVHEAAAAAAAAYRLGVAT